MLTNIAQRKRRSEHLPETLTGVSTSPLLPACKEGARERRWIVLSLGASHPAEDLRSGWNECRGGTRWSCLPQAFSVEDAAVTAERSKVVIPDSSL